MFNNKIFCIIIVLTAIALGATLYFQVEEMNKYDLLDKLKTEYLSGILGDDSAAPAESTDEAKEDAPADETKNEVAEDDKK